MNTNNTTLWVMLLGLLILSVFAPFSALSLMLIFLVGATLFWMGWTLIEAFRGESQQEPDHKS
ncbi:MAG: hypothetical protein SFW36_13825 [Leptolyngbyaceae cyanobacterium bins.59]|nr:hypothetical protein [Leptolyngbyaceae cyanobacterium bins.59]